MRRWSRRQWKLLQISTVGFDFYLPPSKCRLSLLSPFFSSSLFSFFNSVLLLSCPASVKRVTIGFSVLASHYWFLCVTNLSSPAIYCTYENMLFSFFYSFIYTYMILINRNRFDSRWSQSSEDDRNRWNGHRPRRQEVEEVRKDRRRLGRPS